MHLVNCRRNLVFDLPGVIDIAREAISLAGLSDNLTTIGGNYNESIPSEGFNDAFLFAVVHQQDMAKNKKLLRRIFNALKPGGRLFLTSFFTNDEGTSPLQSALFAVEMTVMIPGGRTYSNTEIEKLIKNAGFVDIECIDTIPGPSTLYTAIRPR